MSEMYFLFCLLQKQMLPQNKHNQKGVSQNYFSDFVKHLCLSALLFEQNHLLFLYYCTVSGSGSGKNFSITLQISSRPCFVSAENGITIVPSFA